MKPVTVSIDVPQSIDDVYAFLDVMANHEQFTDHMLRDWRLSGPASGVGSQAHLNAVIAGRSEPVDIEVVEAQAPRLIVERNVGAHGKRVAHGTYRLSARVGGGTTVTFEYAWQSAPLPERLAAPLLRPVMKRGLDRAMQRLATTLAADPTARATDPATAPATG